MTVEDLLTFGAHTGGLVRLIMEWAAVLPPGEPVLNGLSTIVFQDGADRELREVHYISPLAMAFMTDFIICISPTMSRKSSNERKTSHWPTFSSP